MPHSLRARTTAAVIATVVLLMLFSTSNGMGFNISQIGSLLIMTAFWIAIIGGGIWLAVEFFGVLNTRKSGMHDDATSILRQRYARGEINRAEYFQMMQDLENGVK